MALLLSLGLLLTAGSSAAAETGSEPVTVTFFKGEPGEPPAADNKIYRMIEEKLGIRFEFEFLTTFLDEALGMKTLDESSLPDLLDGSNTAKPKAQQGMLVRAAFSFEEGEEPLKLTVIPIQPCGTKTKDKNDYSPTAELTKKAAESILRCLWQDTADQVLDRLTFRLPGQS